MIQQETEHPLLNALEVIQAARQRLKTSQGACSAENPDLLKASSEGLLKENRVTSQVREQINQELGILEIQTN